MTSPTSTSIKPGDKVLLQLPSGDFRSIQIPLKPSAAKISLGKFGAFGSHQLVGHPFGLSYDIDPDGGIKSREPETVVELDETGATNELISDGRSIQPLSFQEIETLKKTPGVNASDIIQLQIAQNVNFSLKTEYSKDKYKKRKEAKFRQGFAVVEPTMFNICSYLFIKDAQRIKGIRGDTLSQMMSFANVRPGARVLVVDDTGGLLVAAVLERLGGQGHVMTIADTESPPQYHILEHLNLPAEVLTDNMTYVNWSEVDKSYVPVETYEPEEVRGESQKHRQNRRLSKAEQARVRREMLWAGEWDALLISTEYDAFEVMQELQPYLAGSASVVVHCPFLQPLTDLHQKLRYTPSFLAPSITESWLRQYQALPGRTHPMMNMSGSGGYLLTAMKVFDDDRTHSALKAANLRRKEKAAMQANGLAGSGSGANTPLGGQTASTVDNEVVEDMLAEAE